MDLIVLVCIGLAALAAGVLVAYGTCVAMFAAFRMHARQVAVTKPAASVATVTAAASVAQS